MIVIDACLFSQCILLHDWLELICFDNTHMDIVQLIGIRKTGRRNGMTTINVYRTSSLVLLFVTLSKYQTHFRSCGTYSDRTPTMWGSNISMPIKTKYSTRIPLTMFFDICLKGLSKETVRVTDKIETRNTEPREVMLHRKPWMLQKMGSESRIGCSLSRAASARGMVRIQLSRSTVVMLR